MWAVILIVLGFNAALAAAPRPTLTVVLDPGHGGNDLGTSHHFPPTQKRKSVHEKEISLQLARRIAAELRVAGHRVHLTREGDEEIPLPERTALANRLKADLFISIHLNSSPEQDQAEGVETFILNQSTDAASKRLADLENAVLKSSTASIDGAGDVSLIVKDLILNANHPKSQWAACLIQKELVQATRRNDVSPLKRNRGVKQGLFYVLLGADMPSILVEAGFLSHQKDRELLLSALGQMKIARAFGRAIQEFTQAPQGTALPAHCKIR